MSAETPHSAVGAKPTGATDEKSAARAVQLMFDEIAPRYDLLNHALSANIDKVWWRRTARTFRFILTDPKAHVLDLCCGTGDMTLALSRLRPPDGCHVLGMDFAHQMLRRGAQKFRGQGIVAVEADALTLPLPDGCIDLVTAAFGFRNLANYHAGLLEIRRVLRKGGEFGILDFSEPGGLLGRLYAFYFRHILPRIGGLISGSSASYTYLPASVERFPAPEAMVEQMKAAGFSEVSWTPYTFGIAGLYRGRK